MRILEISNLYPPHYLGGYELICEAVTNNLRRRGHEISLLTSNHIRAGISVTEERGIERTLRIHGLYGHPWLGIRRLKELEFHNNEILRRAVERTKPDLVYVWNLGGLSKSMLFTLEKLGVPVVFYLSDHWIARGADADVWQRWWNRKAVSLPNRVLRAAMTASGLRKRWSVHVPTDPFQSYHFRRIYFCSKALRKLTASAGIDVMHGAVIYCPVDTDRFTGEVKPVVNPVQNLLWVGRLSEDKGIMTALRAMKIVRDVSTVRLKVFGGGDQPYVDQLKKFVSEYQLPVEFSSVASAEMPATYRSHDALIFTSEWAEPFALTPIEAMASGLPVIGTTTGGSRELFRHGDNALTYTAGNAEELAARIVELTQQPDLRTRIAVTGQAEVRANYAEPIIVDQIEKYLQETVATWGNKA